MIVIIDNYDSFTYNLYQRLAVYHSQIQVVRNDKVRVEDIALYKPDYIVISPGPCTPLEAGISIDVVKTYKEYCPILGVCLGHQAIAQAFGAGIIKAHKVYHGKTSHIFHDGKGVFHDLPSPFQAARYHSLIVDWKSLPDCFTVSAWTEDQVIMGLRHKMYPIEALQFHPESYMTEKWETLLQSFLALAT